MKIKFLGYKGFTLIELIIVFSVIAVISLFGIASFINYSKAQAITNDAYNIVNLINTAKANSVSQVKPSSCNVGKVLQGYIVELNKTVSAKTNKGYSINVLCSVAPASPLATYSLSSNVTFDTTAVDALKSIEFRVLSGGVKLIDKNDGVLNNSSQLSGTITLTGFNATLKRIITIDRHGNISVSQ